ncbi:MAG: DUF4845 domain-containing protein [Candidatus Dactylopiibacterium sp.]|nr:DUF4845 domain-containing protein [Candidatus Dactylopiibacterium sp.]
MKRQRGLTLISTLIVGMLAAACLVVGFKLIPVFTEYFAVKSAFAKIVSSQDQNATPGQIRSAFQRYADIDDIKNVDPQTLLIDKDGGKIRLHVNYRREVALFANTGLYFDFEITSN